MYRLNESTTKRLNYNTTTKNRGNTYTNKGKIGINTYSKLL